MTSFLCATRAAISNPREATLLASSASLSSNDRQTPGSPNSVAPRTRNSIPNRVFPQPASPHTRVGRPCGRPPNVISSKPEIPVGHFGRVGLISGLALDLEALRTVKAIDYLSGPRNLK